MKNNILLLLASILLIPNFIIGQVNEQDSLALVDLYNSTDGANWINNNNWLTEPVKYWTGISVVNNRVVKIAIVANDLKGSIPSSIGNLTELTSLSLYGSELNPNNLKGSIPISVGNLTALTHLNLSNNKLTGEIPASIGNLSSLISLTLSGNYLTGEIPATIGNLSSLMHLTLYNNNLTGDISSVIENLSELWSLTINNNNLSGDSSIMINNLSKLSSVTLYNNQFNFGDLEPFSSLDLSRFLYSPQDTLDLKAEMVGDSIRLTFDKANGTQTSYQWLKKNETGYYARITTTAVNNYKIHKSENIQNWRCRAKNSLLTKLELIGLSPEGIEQQRDCWETGLLAFCLSSGEWEKGSGTNKIKTTNIISINDFLFFDGTMTIDTSKLGLEASGEFYFNNIPIPGGGLGKYTLLKGEQNLTLIGNEGKILDFLNSGLSKTASLFGAPLKIDDLQFFKRQDTLGVRVGCSAKIPWVSESCGTSNIFTPQGIDLKLKNLEITNKGIMSAGFEVENLGLFSKGQCLKKIDFEYDWKKDIMIAGGDIALPFIKVDLGGGFKLEKGEIDSVAWRAEYLPGDNDNKKAIPIGFYTLGVKGFSGHISGLNQPGEFNPLNMSFELAGTFSDITSENWYRLEGKGHTIWPKEFNIKGEGQFLKPMDGIPYQLRGDTEMSYNVSENCIYMGFDGQCGTMGDEIWLIDGFGCFNLTLDKYLIPRFSGNIGGLLTLPKLENNWFFNWLDMIVDFPITLHSNNKFNDKYLNLIHGSASIQIAQLESFSIRYVVDLYRRWNQSGFFRIVDDKPSTKSAFVKESSVFATSNSTTFNVPENNSFGVIEIKSKNTIPASSITSPLGKIYSESAGEDNILYTESEDGKVAFWTLVESTPGDWTITLENPAQSDSIITHFQLKDQEFKFSMKQTGNTVTVSWDVSQVKSGQTVNILLDTDNANFDGFKIKDEDATLGTVSFVLDEEHPGCNYYLYAQLFDEFSLVEAYAEDIIDNPLATLAPPENLSSEYNSETGEFNFTWTENPTSEITGYILSVTDELGIDSVYAILNSNQTSISLFIENFETKSAKIESYNEEWKIGCPTESLELTTGINDFLEFNEPDNKLNVFPNPTNGSCTIRYFVSEDSHCEIILFDINGRVINYLHSGYQNAGLHEKTMDYNNLPNGIYIIKYLSNKESYTVKSILNK